MPIMKKGGRVGVLTLSLWASYHVFNNLLKPHDLTILPFIILTLSLSLNGKPISGRTDTKTPRNLLPALTPERRVSPRQAARHPTISTKYENCAWARPEF